MSSLYCLAMGTFGFSELVLFPYEVARQVKRVAFGQTMRYEFTPGGKVSLSIDGRVVGKDHELRKLDDIGKSSAK